VGVGGSAAPWASPIATGYWPKAAPVAPDEEVVAGLIPPAAAADVPSAGAPAAGVAEVPAAPGLLRAPPGLVSGAPGCPKVGVALGWPGNCAGVMLPLGPGTWPVVVAGAVAGAGVAGSGAPVAGRATLGMGICAQLATVVKLSPPATARVRKACFLKRIRDKTAGRPPRRGRLRGDWQMQL